MVSESLCFRGTSCFEEQESKIHISKKSFDVLKKIRKGDKHALKKTETSRNSAFGEQMEETNGKKVERFFRQLLTKIEENDIITLIRP